MKQTVEVCTDGKGHVNSVKHWVIWKSGLIDGTIELEVSRTDQPKGWQVVFNGFNVQDDNLCRALMEAGVSSFAQTDNLVRALFSTLGPSKETVAQICGCALEEVAIKIV